MLKVADSINHAHKQTTGVCVVLENVAGGVSHCPPCSTDSCNLQVPEHHPQPHTSRTEAAVPRL